MSAEVFPFNDSLELVMLSAFRQDRKLWVKMHEHIEYSYFKSIHHANVFKIFKPYFNKYKEFPTEDICLSLAEKKNFPEETLKAIKLIYKQKHIQNHEIEFLYDQCNKFIKEQKIRHSIIKSIDYLEQNKIDDIETEIKQAVSWNNDVDLGRQIVDARERYNELEELYDNAILWPWERLNLLNLRMYRRTLNLVVAASSVGKSIFLDNCAYHAWEKQGKNVISITLEISELKKGQRMDAYGLKMPLRELMQNRDKVIKFYESKKHENRLFIKEFPTSKATVEKDIANYLYNLELYAGLHKKDIDLIVIDYGDILKPHKPLGNMYIDGGSVFESMRALAQEYDCPLLSASQLSKSSIQNCQTIDELSEVFLAESFKKMMISDLMIGLMNTPEERARGIINMKVLKSRETQKDLTLNMKIDYPSLRIFDK